jgi:predicted metal-dependent hydrolase
MIAEQVDLGGTFRSIGTTYGYEEVEADFESYKEFKSTWLKCGKKVSFKISDYLNGADTWLIGDFARSLYTRIAKNGPPHLYSDRLKAYLQSEEFVTRNQPTYIRRSRNLSKSPQGRNYNLKETYENLLAKGMVKEFDHTSLNWTRSDNHMRVGSCSVLMKVISISSVLDNDAVPDYVHEYVLYHELLHLEDGLDVGKRHHTSSFKARERAYPKWRESEDWLKRVVARRADLS